TVRSARRTQIPTRANHTGAMNRRESLLLSLLCTLCVSVSRLSVRWFPLRRAEDRCRPCNNSWKGLLVVIILALLLRCCRRTSLNFENGFNLHRDVTRQRPHAHCAARTDSIFLPKDFSKQLAATIDHCRVVSKVRRGIHHSQRFQQAPHSIQRTQFRTK